jgi:tRNA(Arg) A34 adenosine deaminase TadA
MTATDRFLEAAIEEARQGLAEGGIPTGSVIVHRDRIIGRGHNRRVQKQSAFCTARWMLSKTLTVSLPSHLHG